MNDDRQDSSPYDLYRRGAAFLAQGHPGQAAMLLERATVAAPGKNSIREALARAYFQLGRYDRSAELFAAIVEDVPVNDYAHFGLGCALVNLNRLREARRHFRLAVAMRPDSAEYRERLLLCEARLPHSRRPV